MKACNGLLVLIVMCLPLSGWAFDPMAPPGFNKGTIDNAMQNGKASQTSVKTQAKKTEGFTLRQVVISNAGKSAVINGYIVNEGSYLNNAYVKTIEANSVTLLVKGKIRQLTLEESIPKIRR